MKILQSTLADMEHIFGMYDLATAYQKTKFNKHWLPFDRGMVKEEISMGRQWKIIEDGRIACIFATAYDDPFIWQDKNSDPSVYLHRIVTHPDFRGKKYMNTIIDWATIHAREKEKMFLRMDTWGDNKQLIDYYVKCGFTFVGTIIPDASGKLPAHYSAIFLALLEIKL